MSENLVLRMNLDTEDIELVVDGKLVDTVGPDVVASWVTALNEKRKAAIEPHTEDTLLVNVIPEVPATPVEPVATTPAAVSPEEVPAQT